MFGSFGERALIDVAKLHVACIMQLNVPRVAGMG